MGTRFKKARFHIDYGPPSLFQHVLYKMDTVSTVKTNANHFHDRARERNIPSEVMERIQRFRLTDWALRTCEVRIDTGKFVNSTWETEYDNQRFWLTIGFGNVAETIIVKTSAGTDAVVCDGPLYDFVEAVNHNLMIRELEG